METALAHESALYHHHSEEYKQNIASEIIFLIALLAIAYFARKTWQKRPSVRKPTQ